MDVGDLPLIGDILPCLGVEEKTESAKIKLKSIEKEEGLVNNLFSLLFILLN